MPAPGECLVQANSQAVINVPFDASKQSANGAIAMTATADIRFSASSPSFERSIRSLPRRDLHHMPSVIWLDVE
jgi:hypothetical protein